VNSGEEEGTMIDGVHVLLYSREAEKVRAFFRDVLGRRSVDAGDGWLIFALPPAELAVHPTDGAGHHELYLMCDDIEKTTDELAAKGIPSTPVEDQGWGLVTTLELPGGDELGLYEPRHDTALALSEG
jgi:catechol 2,3-dioxygenase-like lactoylglutathione lyase family enzyme